MRFQEIAKSFNLFITGFSQAEVTIFSGKSKDFYSWVRCGWVVLSF